MRNGDRLRGPIAAWIIVLALGGASPSLAASQASQQRLRVATREIPPFVYKENNRLTGFSIDLWQAIADEMKVGSSLVEYSTIPELLSSVKSGKADLGIAAISITAERSNE